MHCQLFAQKCSNCQDIKQKYQNVRGHSAIGNIHDNIQDFFVIGYHYITARHSKQLPVGLMVLSDGKVHIENFQTNLPNLSCGFKLIVTCSKTQTYLIKKKIFVAVFCLFL